MIGIQPGAHYIGNRGGIIFSGIFDHLGDSMKGVVTLWLKPAAVPQLCKLQSSIAHLCTYAKTDGLRLLQENVQGLLPYPC